MLKIWLFSSLIIFGISYLMMFIRSIIIYVKYELKGADVNVLKLAILSLIPVVNLIVLAASVVSIFHVDVKDLF